MDWICRASQHHPQLMVKPGAALTPRPSGPAGIQHQGPWCPHMPLLGILAGLYPILGADPVSQPKVSPPPTPTPQLSSAAWTPALAELSAPRRTSPFWDFHVAGVLLIHAGTTPAQQSTVTSYLWELTAFLGSLIWGPSLSKPGLGQPVIWPTGAWAS